MKRYFVSMIATMMFVLVALPSFGNENTIQMTVVKSKDVEMKMSGTGEMTIDWDDGTSKTYTLSEERISLSHRYSKRSRRTITITGNVTDLWFANYEITGLDVSRNTALAKLYCGSNKIKSLDVSRNTALTDLTINTPITSLNLSKNTALTYLKISGTQITSLDLSENTALTDLHLVSTQLTAIAFDTLFGTLYSNSIDGVKKSIYISSTKGNETFDQNIAIAKGWAVYTP